MNVKELKELIRDLPDYALVLTDTPHAVVEAKAKVGSAQTPNNMGFTTFLDEDRFEYPAVFIHAPV